MRYLFGPQSWVRGTTGSQLIKIQTGGFPCLGCMYTFPFHHGSMEPVSLLARDPQAQRHTCNAQILLWGPMDRQTGKLPERNEESTIQICCSRLLQRFALGLKVKQTSDFKTMYSREWPRKNQQPCMFSQGDASIPSSKVQVLIWIASKERVENEEEAFICSRIAHQCNQAHPERGHSRWRAPAYTTAVQATGAHSKPWEHIVVQNPGCLLRWGRWKKPF